jgi:hypothetical protein
MKAVRWVPTGLAIVAEGAWIAVIAAFLQELLLRGSVLGLPQFVAATAVGVLAARALSPRLGPRWPVVGLALAIVAAGVGLIAAPDAREAVLAGRLWTDGPLGMNPGGLLIGLAVLRGYGQATFPPSEDRLGRLLVGGIVALSLIALMGGLVAEPFRSRFESEALLGALVFSGAAVLALALARLTVIGAESGAEWTRNPAWLALILAIVGIVEVAAAPAAGVVGPALELVVGVAIGPVIVLGLIFGWTRATIQAVLFVGIVGAALFFWVALTGSTAPGTTTPGGTGGGPSVPPPAPSPGVTTIGIGLLLTVGAVILLLLIRAWMRGVSVWRGSPDETRTIDRGDEELPEERHRRRLLRGAPSTAVAAYRRLIADLDGRPIVARAPSETPHEHARRIRSDGWGRIGLDLLVADYTLDRFAGRPVTPAEDRRGVRRWRRLRGELQPPTPPSIEKPRPTVMDRRLARFGQPDDLAPGGPPGDDVDR